jgi:hypothetical protein
MTREQLANHRRQAAQTLGAYCLSGPEMVALLDEIERLRAALRGALSMVDSFASGAGFSHAGWAEYERYRAALEPKP